MSRHSFAKKIQILLIIFSLLLLQPLNQDTRQDLVIGVVATVSCFPASAKFPDNLHRGQRTMMNYNIIACSCMSEETRRGYELRTKHELTFPIIYQTTNK